jgi:hypothetical protein
MPGPGVSLLIRQQQQLSTLYDEPQAEEPGDEQDEEQRLRAGEPHEANAPLFQFGNGRGFGSVSKRRAM